MKSNSLDKAVTGKPQMPIHKMNFSDGVFYASKVGYTDAVDGKMWANALKKYASKSDFPITALVDLTQVDRLCPTLIKVYAKIMEEPNVHCIAIIINDAVLRRNGKVIDKLDAIPGVKAFTDVDIALSYCDGQLRPAIGAAASKFAVMYSIATPQYTLSL